MRDIYFKDLGLHLISRFLWKCFGYDTKWILWERFSEFDRYVISEPRCAGCGVYQDKDNQHKYKRPPHSRESLMKSVGKNGIKQSI